MTFTTQKNIAEYGANIIPDEPPLIITTSSYGQAYIGEDEVGYLNSFRFMLWWLLWGIQLCVWGITIWEKAWGEIQEFIIKGNRKKKTCEKNVNLKIISAFSKYSQNLFAKSTLKWKYYLYKIMLFCSFSDIFFKTNWAKRVC